MSCFLGTRRLPLPWAQLPFKNTLNSAQEEQVRARCTHIWGGVEAAGRSKGLSQGFGGSTFLSRAPGRFSAAPSHSLSLPRPRPRPRPAALGAHPAQRSHLSAPC